MIRCRVIDDDAVVVFKFIAPIPDFLIGEVFVCCKMGDLGIAA